MKNIVRSLSLIICCSALSACGGSNGDTPVAGVGSIPLNNLNSENGSPTLQGAVTLNETTPGEDEGPSFQTPTMENLMGKPQKFPAGFPVRRYPNGQVAFVRTERVLYPGWKNQVMLKTTDSVQRVASFYRYDFAKAGWAKVRDYQNPAYSSTVWQKDGTEVEVRVSPDPDGNECVQLFSGPVQQQRQMQTQPPPQAATK